MSIGTAIIDVSAVILAQVAILLPSTYRTSGQR